MKIRIATAGKVNTFSIKSKSKPVMCTNEQTAKDFLNKLNLTVQSRSNSDYKVGCAEPIACRLWQAVTHTYTGTKHRNIIF